MSKANPIWLFTVEGSGEFPFDMLRYDRCWPNASDPDVINLGLGPRSSVFGKPRMVTLRGETEPTTGRWESFGWKVRESRKVT